MLSIESARRAPRGFAGSAIAIPLQARAAESTRLGHSLIRSLLREATTTEAARRRTFP